MKKIQYITVLTFLFITTGLHAQSIVGAWHGLLEVQGIKLRVVFNVSQDSGSYSSTMDSPDQGALEIPTTSTSFEKDSLTIRIKNMGISYAGHWNGKTIVGIFSQGGMDIPMTLSQSPTAVPKKTIRPQDPIKPYPYYTEEVTFINNKANGIKLAGTLTLPKGVNKPPVVILISGSGGQNRDEEIDILNHRPFLVWSDYLTNHGIAVLRYDDRGIAASEGNHSEATSADFATDVEAAVSYLQNREDININKIGLVGHSEGGYIAPMVAAKNKSINFIVLLAGPGVGGDEILSSQSRKASELAGATSEELKLNDRLNKGIHKIILAQKDDILLKEKIATYLKETRSTLSENEAKGLTDERIEMQASTFSSVWMTYFIRTHPDQFLSQVKCPVLAINGDKDSQVLADLNLDGIAASLKGAKNEEVTIVKLSGLNHLFQTAETGSFDEYGKIEETVSPEVMKLVVKWIHQETANK